ncbi:DUF2798 domain-containing protein [Ensifer sp. Root278]|uniref:DUF2798 domain-containing protein n=1 Tax=Ensifer sp. Root278 TaxID=1736509 RepID=UPI00070E7349|nr:DUF2798 domain-containing protein [Ensifer sp. Root278]KRD49594.1 hypothetical protein ASE60_19160 [Ensifer sp. Root278]
MPKKLPHRYQAIVMPLVLSVLMSAIVSFVSTASGSGLQPDLLALWLKAWAFSWLVAFPSLLVVLPVVRRIVAATVEQPRSSP